MMVLKKKEVVIEVVDGCWSVISKPDDVVVVMKDYDWDDKKPRPVITRIR
jgi:hypothetical protein